MRKKTSTIPERLKPYVTQEKNNNLKNLMIGLISFILTILSVYTFPVLFRQVGKLPVAFRSIFSQSGVNINKVFLSGAEKSVDPLLVKSVIDKKDKEWIFVDYRSAEEYKAAHIRGAINIPLYTNYKQYLESMISLEQWYRAFWSTPKSGKKVLIYGYWDKSKLSTDVKTFLQKKGEDVYTLTVGFTEFKNDFSKWVPGGDMNENSVASYIEGSLVAPSAVFDGVPPLPSTK